MFKTLVAPAVIAASVNAQIDAFDFENHEFEVTQFDEPVGSFSMSQAYISR